MSLYLILDLVYTRIYHVFHVMSKNFAKYQVKHLIYAAHLSKKPSRYLIVVAGGLTVMFVMLKKMYEKQNENTEIVPMPQTLLIIGAYVILNVILSP